MINAGSQKDMAHETTPGGQKAHEQQRQNLSSHLLNQILFTCKFAVTYNYDFRIA